MIACCISLLQDSTTEQCSRWFPWAVSMEKKSVKCKQPNRALNKHSEPWGAAEQLINRTRLRETAQTEKSTTDRISNILKRWRRPRAALTVWWRSCLYDEMQSRKTTAERCDNIKNQYLERRYISHQHLHSSRQFITWLTCRDKQPFTLTFTPTGNLETPVNLSCISSWVSNLGPSCNEATVLTTKTLRCQVKQWSILLVQVYFLLSYLYNYTYIRTLCIWLSQPPEHCWPRQHCLPEQHGNLQG